MCVLEKPSTCDVEKQAGVHVIDGRGEGSRVKHRLLWIGTFSLCLMSVSCIITMFVWIRNMEMQINVNAQNYQKLLEMQRDFNVRAKYDDDDDNDDNEDYPLSDDLVVRALRDGNVKNAKKAKGKNRKSKNKKRHRRGKKGCQCDDLLKKLKSKRDVSGQSSHILTYLKGLPSSQHIEDPYNYEGQFLWQNPHYSLGNYFQYNRDPSRNNSIKSILIGVPGAYELKAQVTMKGSTTTVDNPECGVELIKSRGGVETELARTVITQARPASYGQNSNIKVLDNVKVGGIFHLFGGDEVFARRSCNHAKFVLNDKLSSFSVVLLKNDS